MTVASLQPDDAGGVAWPPQFRPRAEPAAGVASPSVRFPTALADLFYVRSNQVAPVHLVAACACLGEEFDALVGDVAALLREDASEVEEQAQATLVAHRGVLRGIDARELFVGTADVVEQPPVGSAVNAPATVHARMWARLAIDGPEARRTPLDRRGRISVGRLDLLYACRAALAHPFHNPLAPAERVYGLLVPLDQAAVVADGRSLALVYPMPDAAVGAGLDNTAVVMRVVHDLLSRLQADMDRAGVAGPFVERQLPHWSRADLEASLARDGYTVRGDVAIAPPGSRLPAADETDLGGRLRRWMAGAAADRIVLPPEATPDDYRGIIAAVLPLIATARDLAMLDALSRRIADEVSPRAPVRPAPPARVPAESPRAAQPAARPSFPAKPLPPSSAPKPAVMPRSTGRRERTGPKPTPAGFSGDFAAPPQATPSPSPMPFGADFAAAERVEPDDGTAPPPEGAKPPAAGTGRRERFEDDFAMSGPPPPPSGEWPSVDFEADFGDASPERANGTGDTRRKAP